MPKPETWRANPSTGLATPLLHWSQLKDFNEQQGDVKWIWEPSRFDWAVTLARAFAATADEKYRARFAELLADWRVHNPPNQGINWFCGQECSLRILALVFAAGAFGDLAELWSTVAALAERVEPSLGYALGQHNNHGISEAMGLYLAGMCLPEHPSSRRWCNKGKDVLCQMIREQFAPDGSYVQHSFVYQRLAMRGCLAAFLAARIFDDRFPKDLEERVLASARFLRELMVPAGEGRLPNYGANDGANALSLSECDYLDFRPIVQLTFALLAQERAFDEGPWDQELAWFGKDGGTLGPVEPLGAEGFAAPRGGYYVLRSRTPSPSVPDHRPGKEGPEVYAFMRVPHYTDGRPSHADALHADIWFAGKPVAIDSGTYSYNDPYGWASYFKSTSAHNTVVVDGVDQMPSAGRFLFTHWTKAKLLRQDPTHMVGRSFAYRQVGLGVTHTREIEIGPGFVAVTDLLTGHGRHVFELSWHLHGLWAARGDRIVGPGDVELAVSCSLSTMPLVGGPSRPNQVLCTDQSPDATQSLCYGQTTEASRLLFTVEAPAPAKFVSVFHTPEADSHVLAKFLMPTREGVEQAACIP